jgi:hypothetical protein
MLVSKGHRTFEYLKSPGIQSERITYIGQFHLESIMDVLEDHENAQLLLDIMEIVLGNEVHKSIKMNYSRCWKFRSLLMLTVCPVECPYVFPNLAPPSCLNEHKHLL